jgi:exopolysaccharide production protein ExoQ
MATTVIQGLTPRTKSTRFMPQLVLGWVLIIPLVFYAVHGTPSFESLRSSGDSASSLSGLATNGRQSGFVESILIPGVAFSIVMWLLIKNVKRVLSMALQMWVQTLLSLLTILSLAWSQDPFRSAYNGCFCFIETLFAYYLVTKFDVEELRSVLMMAGFAISIVGLAMVLLTPQFSVTSSARDGVAWTGLFTDRTSTGKAMVFLLSPAIVFVRKTFRYRHILYFLLLSFLTFMAHAATARVILILYIAVMAAIRFYKTFGRRSSVVIAGILAAAGAVVVSAGFMLSSVVLTTLGRNATLSGRTVIWGFVARSIAKRPLLGYGFYSFWLGMKGESARLIVGTHWTFGYAHNGVLEIWLQLGLVGVVLFFITLLQATKNAWFCLRHDCPPGVQWYIGLIVLTMLYNVDESTVFWPIDLLTILYLVACAGLSTAARQIRQVEAMEAMYK